MGGDEHLHGRPDQTAPTVPPPGSLLTCWVASPVSSAVQRSSCSGAPAPAATITSAMRSSDRRASA